MLTRWLASINQATSSSGYHVSLWFLSNSQPQMKRIFGPWNGAPLFRCTDVQRPGGQPAWVPKDKVNHLRSAYGNVNFQVGWIHSWIWHIYPKPENRKMIGISENCQSGVPFFSSERCSSCLVLPKISGIEWPRCTGHYLQQVIPRNPISKSAESKAIAGIIREDGFGMVWP